jgi:hypothetical protein
MRWTEYIHPQGLGFYIKLIFKKKLGEDGDIEFFFVPNDVPLKLSLFSHQVFHEFPKFSMHPPIMSPIGPQFILYPFALSSTLVT